MLQQPVTKFTRSRLYNEKAYVLSRGFVRRALEVPPGSLENEIRWFYITQGKLQKVIGDAKQLMRESEELEMTMPGGLKPKSSDQHQRAVAQLSAGARLLLARTMSRLEEIEVASLKEEIHLCGA
jgi:ubiquitin-conjugating enzyme E2 O